MYHITDYTKHKAKRWGLDVYPSKKKDKKIDVYKDDQFIKSIGDINYSDYPSYLKEEGKAYADERRRLYHIRHTKQTLGEKLSRWLLW
jgi:hypothetical protein